MRARIDAIIRRALADLILEGKTGKQVLQPTIAEALETNGLRAEMEDTGQYLRKDMPGWRDKNTNQVEGTKARLKIDIVVYDGPALVALVETESDLNDLRVEGVTNRNGHYDVFSIAHALNGEHFHSYKSLERMAAAAFYAQMDPYPAPAIGVAALEQVRSDSATVHNPSDIPLFLVAGIVRQRDAGILGKRLQSLNAALIAGRG